MAGKQYPPYFEVFVNTNQVGPTYMNEKSAVKAAEKLARKNTYVSVVCASEAPDSVPMAVARWEKGERL